MPLEAIVILGSGVLVIGVTLFYIIRFITYFFHPEYRSAPEMSAAQWLDAVWVISGLLVLLWYIFAGSTMAVVVYIALLAGTKIYAYIFISKSRNGRGRNGT